MNTLEDRLVRALTDAADRNAPDAGLVDRLLSYADHDTAGPRRLRSARRRSSTLLMAAAVAVIVVAGVLVGSRFASQRPPITPPVTPSPSPTVVSSSGGSPTSAPSSTPSPSTGGSEAPTESFITARVTSTGAPAGFTVGSISFRTADQGMALGTARCSTTASDTTRCGVLLSTTDGGLTWSSVTLPAGANVPGTTACPSYGTVQECTAILNVADPAAGYLWGPRQIFRTTDGGATWQSLAVGAGVGTVSQLVSVQGRAFVTVVRGQYAELQAQVREVGPESTALSVSTVSDGAAFGLAQLIQGPGIVYRWLSGQRARVQSSTTGTSWTDLPTPGPKFITILATDDGSLVSDVSDDDAVAQVLPVGSKAWRKVPRPPAPAGGAAGEIDYSLAGAVSAREIAVTVTGFDLDAGGGQAWVTTTDGGRTWSAPVLSTSEAGARGVGASAVMVGEEMVVPWSLGSALLRSSDVGRTWTEIEFPRS